MNRREFLASAAAAGLAGCATAPKSECCGNGTCAAKKGKILFGACLSLRNAKLLKDHGYDFIEGSAGREFIPEKSDEEWKKQKDVILGCGLPMRSVNGFLPGKFRLTGPNADFGPALDYAERVLRRADEVGTKIVVFGSGGARSVPGDFSGDRKNHPDTEKGVEQFTDFCRKLCGRVADLKTVRVVIEPLRPSETNIINYVWQGMQVVRDVNSPILRQLADIYHMIRGRESARSIEEASESLLHCHIASKKDRQYPGFGENDAEIFRPYFDALAKIGYSGGVSCECGWPKDRKEFEKALDKALALMKSLA